MTSISKRDLLKAVPAALPVALLGGVPLSALGGEHVQLRTARITRYGEPFDLIYLPIPKVIINIDDSIEQSSKKVNINVAGNFILNSHQIDSNPGDQRACEEFLVSNTRWRDVVPSILTLIVPATRVTRVIRVLVFGVEILFFLHDLADAISRR